jgi:hypothetical protein
MGYQCPVCDDPQADGHHLANHLAFTAMLGDGDHEAWLDEHVPDWGDADPEGLAEDVTDLAEETEYPQVFEDTTGGTEGDHTGHDHQHDHAHGGSGLDGSDAPPGGVADVGEAFDLGDDDADEVLAEARELTRQRRADEGDDGDESGDETASDGADKADESG